MKLNKLLLADTLLADRTRLVIITLIAASEEEISFMTLLTSLEMTKGNLASHLRKLEDENYIEVRKEFVGRKPLTTYSITNIGKKAVKDYLDELDMFISKVKI